MTETDYDNSHANITLKRVFPDTYSADDEKTDKDKNKPDDREKCQKTGNKSK